MPLLKGAAATGRNRRRRRARAPGRARVVVSRETPTGRPPDEAKGTAGVRGVCPVGAPDAPPQGRVRQGGYRRGQGPPRGRRRHRRAHPLADRGARSGPRRINACGGGRAAPPRAGCGGRRAPRKPLDGSPRDAPASGGRRGSGLSVGAAHRPTESMLASYGCHPRRPSCRVAPRKSVYVIAVRGRARDGDES